MKGQNSRMRSVLLVLSLLLLFPATTIGDSSPVMIRLVDPLDEPEYYCVDIPGFRQNVQLKAPLMAHTLKRFGSADEMWTMNYPNKGQIHASEYGLCIEAASAESGAALMLKEPSDSPLQRFVFTEEGFIVLADFRGLGFAVAPGKGDKAGGPSHLRRDMSLMDIRKIDPSLKTWKLVTSADSWPD